MSENNQDKYKLLYEEMVRYSEESHKKNKRRIAIGLKCLVIIPIVLLLLMFYMTSNRTAFLLIWIISVLIITSVLIGIEYTDYRLQQRLNQINGAKQEVDALTGEKFAEVERRARKIHNELDEWFRIVEEKEEEEEEEQDEEEQKTEKEGKK